MWKSKRRRQQEEAASAEAERLAEERRHREDRAKGNRTAWLSLVTAVVGGVAVWSITGGATKVGEWLSGSDPVQVAGNRTDGEAYPNWTSDNPGFSVTHEEDYHSPTCSITTVIPRAAAEIQPPEFDENNQYAKISEWVQRYGAADPDQTSYAFNVTAKDKTVTIQDARVVFVRHAEKPATATLVELKIGLGCGAGRDVQYFETDLDNSHGRLVPKGDTAGFPYTLQKEETVNFKVAGVAKKCDCIWYVELKWIAEGKKGTTCILDGDSSCPDKGTDVERAFHTMPSSGHQSIGWTLSGQNYLDPPWVSN